MSVNSHPGSHAEPRKRPVQARSRQTVESILAAAARILAERGYLATTTNDVAEAAGVSIGSLYQYFPNKDSLLVALEERHLAAVRTSFAAVVRQWRRDRPDPGTWARSLVDVLVAANDSPVHVLIYDTAPPLPRTQQLVDDVIDVLTTEVAVHLRRWGWRTPPRRAAAVLVVAAVRLVHDLAIREPPGRGRRQTCDEIVRLLAQGARPAATREA